MIGNFMKSYKTIHHRSRFEFEDRKSVFIGEAIPATSESEVLSFIDSVKKHYPDARHHVYAYILRDNAIMRFSDDGEPQGTAGMPILDIIRKRGLTDIAIVVTRYFGGTLLGTGGLVHAYSASAQGAIDEAQVITYDLYTEVSITVSYSDYQKLSLLFSEFEFRTEDTDYGADVEILGRVLSSNVDLFIHKLTEITSGRAKSEILGEKFDY
jgi:uncharacterized YigZ family protein